MAAQWPLVVEQLVKVLPTLPGWSRGVSVFDGPPDEATAENDYLTVGYVDDDEAGTYTINQDDSGFQWVEIGTIRCKLTCRSGDTDMPEKRRRAFALANELETYVRGPSGRRLGDVLSPEGTTDITTEVQSVQSSNGAEFFLVITITYFTVT